MISQTLNARLHQGGRVRLIGDETARKLERGMNKPKGWLDASHDLALSERDAEILHSIASLTASQRALLEGQIAEFVRLNGKTPPGPDAGELAPDLKH